MKFTSFFRFTLCTVLGLLMLNVHAADKAKPKRIVTTFTIIQDMAQNVAGSAAIVESITKPGAEIHEYELTPLDIVKAQSADLVLFFAPKRGLLARRLRRWNNNPGSGNILDNNGGNSSDTPVAKHDPVAGRTHLS